MSLNHARPGDLVDLNQSRPNDSDDRSTALAKTDQFEAIRLVLEPGTKMPSHHVAGRFTLQCMAGHAILHHGSRSAHLRPGSWIYLDRGQTHSVEAIERSVLLLTIMMEAG